MITVEVDHENEQYRRRYVGYGASALILLSSAPGISRDYVEGTLKVGYLDRFGYALEFASISHIAGDQDITLEVAYKDLPSLGDFITELKREDRVLRGSVPRHTFIFAEGKMMHSQGLPWSDVRREAYAFAQLGNFRHQAIANWLEDIADPNYKIMTLEVYGSGRFNTVVIMSSESPSFKDENSGEDSRETGPAIEVPPPFRMVSRLAERIRTAPGVSDSMLYPCFNTLNLYPYNKSMSFESMQTF